MSKGVGNLNLLRQWPRFLAVVLVLQASTPAASGVAFKINIPLKNVQANPGGETEIAAFDESSRFVSSEIKPREVLVVDLGDSIRIEFKGVSQDGFTIDLSTDHNVTYLSENVSIATVSSRGVVTPLLAGQTRVQAQFPGIVGYLDLDIRPGAVITALEPIFNLDALEDMSPEITRSNFAELLVGETAQLDIEATLQDGSKGFITRNASTLYESLNTSVATVDSRGIVKAVGTGEALIRATSHGAATTAAVKVGLPDAAAPVSSVSFLGPNFTLKSQFTTFITTSTLVNISALDPEDSVVRPT